MHCYQTLAAAALVAKLFEELPQNGRRLPLAEAAEWMSQNGIEAEDLFSAGPDEIRAKLVSLIEHRRPPVSIAA